MVTIEQVDDPEAEHGISFTLRVANVGTAACTFSCLCCASIHLEGGGGELAPFHRERWQPVSLSVFGDAAISGGALVLQRSSPPRFQLDVSVVPCQNPRLSFLFSAPAALWPSAFGPREVPEPSSWNFQLQAGRRARKHRCRTRSLAPDAGCEVE